MATTKRPRAAKKTAEPKESTAVSQMPAAKPVATVTTRTVDMREAICLRAYELFQQRGYKHGADLEDWFRAEQEVRQRFNYEAA